MLIRRAIRQQRRAGAHERDPVPADTPGSLRGGRDVDHRGRHMRQAADV